MDRMSTSMRRTATVHHCLVARAPRLQPGPCSLTVPEITEGARMGVIIIREMVGTSPRSWSDAARQAVATASRTVRNIREIEVV